MKPLLSAPYDSNGQLYRRWLAEGRSREEFEKCSSDEAQPLSTIKPRILDSAGYAYKEPGSETFLWQIKTLLGEGLFMLALNRAKAFMHDHRLHSQCAPRAIVVAELMYEYRALLAGGIDPSL
jgi:hypothetical protein